MMRRSNASISTVAASLVVAATATLLTTACRKPDAQEGLPMDAALTPVSATADGSSAVTRGAAAYTPPASSLPCRVVGVMGKVSALMAGTTPGDGGAPLLYQGADLPTFTWIDVAEGARFTAKDPRTTRETTFVGPARVRACVREEEESWIASGSFESAPGAGEAIGAEEWVVSPFGVVRYGAAGLTFIVSAKDGAVTKATLRLDRGTAFLATARDAHAEPWKVTPLHADDVSDAGADAAKASDAGDGVADLEAASWTRIDAPTQVVLTFAQPGSPSSPSSPLARAQASVIECQRTAAVATTLARALASRDAAVGALTARHVLARRMAHVACAVAELRAASLRPDEGRAMVDSVREATARWKSSAPSTAE